jgi:hypothetical protein
MTLKNQGSAWPTRKVGAAIIAGIIVGAAQSALRLWAPDLDATALLAQLDVWVQTLVMGAAAYVTRERA